MVTQDLTYVVSEYMDSTKGALKNHITQILPFVGPRPPVSLNYHFRVTPPLPIYHFLSLSSRHVSTHFYVFLYVLLHF